MRCVAYCRVSTDDKEQLTSFKNQREHYQKLFSSDNDYQPIKYGMLYRKGQEPEYNEDGIFADGPVKIGLNQKHPTARGALV